MCIRDSNCNVITTPLTANEKKVLLYSANLQVRGGFGDEAVRRQAIAEFINCLQQAPYNMSREEALGATKTVSSVNPRTIERDARIEDKLKGDLKELLNAKILTRSECETYLRFEDDKQEEIAKRFVALSNINCYGDDSEGAGKNHIEVMRDTLHDTFRCLLYTSRCTRFFSYTNASWMTSSFCRSKFEIVPAFSISCKSSHRQYSFVESNTSTSLPCPEMYLSPETYSSSYRYTRWFPYFVFGFSTSSGCTSSLFCPPCTLTFNCGFLSSVSFSHFSVSCISNYHFDYIFFSSYILP